ncbi:hypothetical protein ES707_20580 [subsurface metagenome]
MLEKPDFFLPDIINRKRTGQSQGFNLFHQPAILIRVHMIVKVKAVVRTMRIYHETDAKSGFRPRLVHASLQAFHRDGKFFRTIADFLCCPCDAFRQEVAEPLATGNHLNELQHCLFVSEPQLDATGVFGREQSVFVTFHSKGNNLSRGNRVQRVGIAELVALGDGRQVIDAAIGAQ